jgi:hypothetical protein
MAIHPRTTKGALVRLSASADLAEGDALVFQFNPEKLTRTIDRQADGLPRETISFTLEFDATDAMEMPDDNSTIAAHGIYPLLAALQTLMHPAAANVPSWLETFLGTGAIGARPPLALFVWGEQRAVPVRVSRLGISEDQHDPALHPIRASVDIELEVVTDRDLPQNDGVVRIWRRYLEDLREMAELGFSRLP